MPTKSRCVQGWPAIAVPFPATALVLRKQSQAPRFTQAGRKVIRLFQQQKN